MYCPSCAVQNVDGASYCRACGANISLVPQAMTGRLPEAVGGPDDLAPDAQSGRGRHRSALTFEKGVENIFMGTAFLLITVLGALFFRHGFMIWIWMLIPAFTMLGKGTSAMIRTKREQKTFAPFAPPSSMAEMPTASRFSGLSASGTSELATPPTSITEGTTRHLDATASAKPRRTPVE